jgi:uncharacterized membrane protein HdeD (DUF308 family)
MNRLSVHGVAALPQPLKTLYILAFVVVGVTIVVYAFRADELTRWGTGAIGVVALLLGLSVVTNFRDSARGLVEGIKDYKPLGVDYSKSFLASMAFARLFGATATFVGGNFIYLAFFAPEFRVG